MGKDPLLAIDQSDEEFPPLGDRVFRVVRMNPISILQVRYGHS
jgi:hypothetical protein